MLNASICRTDTAVVHLEDVSYALGLLRTRQYDPQGNLRNAGGWKTELTNRHSVAMRRRVLAAIGITYFAFTATMPAAEVRTADQNAVATASKSVPAERHAIRRTGRTL
jgi:hypothetical protein